MLIGTYGVHRYWLVFLFRKHRKDLFRPETRFAELPRVTVQLPMFNEGTVSHRIIDAACRLQYPADRLQVQVLDDSTDGSDRLCAARVAYWKARGVDIELRHRTDRTGYKAGALAEAMQTATGEFITIFDADFVPPPNFLKRVIHHFTDPTIGMVQTRWEHLNRGDSMLTARAGDLPRRALRRRTHRPASQRARGSTSTAPPASGVPPRSKRPAVGSTTRSPKTWTCPIGRSSRGGGFKFLPWVTCPAELPPEINAFKSQQHRWTKGSIQTAIKLLPRLMRAPIPFKVKLEAFFHLTSPDGVPVHHAVRAACFTPRST